MSENNLEATLNDQQVADIFQWVYGEEIGQRIRPPILLLAVSIRFRFGTCTYQVVKWQEEGSHQCVCAGACVILSVV